MSRDYKRHPRSPELEARLRAEARACRDLTNRIGLQWREPQGQAYEQWEEAMERLNQEATEDGSEPVTTNEDDDLINARYSLVEEPSWFERIVDWMALWIKRLRQRF